MESIIIKFHAKHSPKFYLNPAPSHTAGPAFGGLVAEGTSSLILACHYWRASRSYIANEQLETTGLGIAGLAHTVRLGGYDAEVIHNVAGWTDVEGQNVAEALLWTIDTAST